MGGRGAYANTRTPVERTKEQIRSLFRKYEVRSFQFAEDWQHDLVGIKFVRVERAKGDGKAVEVPLGVQMRVAVLERGRARTDYSEVAWGRRERQVWRALYWYLKSQLEAVDFGLRSFTDAFLADIVMADGRTIGDQVKGALMSGKLALPAEVGG